MLISALKIRTFDDAMDYLCRTTNYEQLGPSRYTGRILKLNRMKELAKRIGSPHRRLNVVHIAGTKGKGSVAYMVENIARKARLATGLFVSPHVTELTERIQLNGRKIPKRDFARLLSRIAPHAENMARRDAELRPTFFELINAMAFLYFAEENVGLAVFETGLGGRLDSTNIVRPVVGAITRIGKDHMKTLGTTLEAIAGEKAGILKAGRPFVIAPQKRTPERVIERTAAHVGAKLIRVGREILYSADSEGTVCVTTPLGRHRGLKLGMSGTHQQENAAVAVGIVDELRRQRFDIPPEAIRKGLAAARAPARFETILTEPTVIIDGAHNENSARVLAAELDRLGLRGRRLRLLVGMAHDKDIHAFFKVLAALKPRRTVLTRARSPRAAQTDLMEKIARRAGLHPVAGAGDVKTDAKLELARMRPGEALCVTGSFYVASEAREFFLRCKSAKSSRRA